MSSFERYLSVWVALAMIGGIVVGAAAPTLVNAVAAAELANVNLVVAVLIWAMVYPMMVGVDPGALRDVTRQPKGLLITLAVNWLIKPFTMAALAVLFFEHVFAPWIAPEDATQYIAGLILLGAAPCTAMAPRPRIRRASCSSTVPFESGPTPASPRRRLGGCSAGSAPKPACSTRQACRYLTARPPTIQRSPSCVASPNGPRAWCGPHPSGTAR